MEKVTIYHNPKCSKSRATLKLLQERGVDLEIVEYDTQYHEKRDQMAFEMAEQGDETARSALQRILARDSDPDKQKRATELIAKLDETAN